MGHPFDPLRHRLSHLLRRYALERLGSVNSLGSLAWLSRLQASKNPPRACEATLT
jgi:hypothetical protein